MPSPLARLANEAITLVKPDGSSHKAKALIQPGKILVFDVRFPVAVGDEIRHALPSGVVQRFQVLDPGFVGGPKEVRHYKISVREASSPRVQAPSVVNNHNYYNSGIANVMGPDGVASSNNNSLDRGPDTTATTLPDVRVLVSFGFAQYGNGVLADLLIIEVQNHSPNPFFLATIKLIAADGRTGLFMRDDATGSVNGPTTIMPGDSHSLRISVERLRHMDVCFDTALVVDKIGRMFESDRTRFSGAMKTLGLKQL